MPQTPEPPIAEKLAEKQKSISIAEFFEKNKQMLGFDSLQRSLITTIKGRSRRSLRSCCTAPVSMF
jgi:DNA topoisomerase-6 subunit B